MPGSDAAGPAPILLGRRLRPAFALRSFGWSKGTTGRCGRGSRTPATSKTALRFRGTSCPRVGTGWAGCWSFGERLDLFGVHLFFVRVARGRIGLTTSGLTTRSWAADATRPRCTGISRTQGRSFPGELVLLAMGAEAFLALHRRAFGDKGSCRSSVSKGNKFHAAEKREAVTTFVAQTLRQAGISDGLQARRPLSGTSHTSPGLDKNVSVWARALAGPLKSCFAVCSGRGSA